MAYKKDLVAAKNLTGKAMERFPFVMNKAVEFMEKNIDSEDHKAGERAFKIFSKIFDKFVPDPPKPKGASGGEISEALSDLVEGYISKKRDVDLTNAVEAEVVDGSEKSS